MIVNESQDANGKSCRELNITTKKSSYNLKYMDQLSLTHCITAHTGWSFLGKGKFYLQCSIHDVFDAFVCNATVL